MKLTLRKSSPALTISYKSFDAAGNMAPENLEAQTTTEDGIEHRCTLPVNGASRIIAFAEVNAERDWSEQPPMLIEMEATK